MNGNSTKTSRSRRIVIAAGVVVALAAAAGAYAVATGTQECMHKRRAELAKDLATLRVEWALRAVDATDAQRQQIAAVLDRSFAELQALHGDHAAMHARVMGMLTADTVDRAAIETFRLEALKRIEQGTKVIAAAVADAADALTPEQRRKLAEIVHGEFE